MTMALLPQLRCSLAPELRQSLKLLQLSAPDLIAYLRDIEEDNPLVELVWTDGHRRVRDLPEPRSGRSGDFPPPRSATGEGETLERSLVAQLRLTAAPAAAKQCAIFLAGSLNENGYVEIGLEEAAACLGVAHADVEAGLRLLQSLEPAGVAARSLGECLLLQIGRDERAPSAARLLAESHLNDTALGRWKAISRSTGVPVEELQRAFRYLRSLDPRPGAPYAGANVPYVIPEAKLSGVRDSGDIAIFGAWMPRIVVHPYTRSKEKGSQEWRDWLEVKSKEADGLKGMLRYRAHALVSVIRAIAYEQRPFLAEGPSAIRPMKLEQIASITGFHLSTVSRAVRDKFVDTPYGVVPLSRFFSSGLSSDRGSPVSARAVKYRIRSLIAGEDKRNPLSDHRLSEKLREEGVMVSRRTVAKYREEERLLPAYLRAQRTDD